MRTTRSFRDADFFHAIALSPLRILSTARSKLTLSQLFRRGNKHEVAQTRVLRARPRNGTYPFHSTSISRNTVMGRRGWKVRGFH